MTRQELLESVIRRRVRPEQWDVVRRQNGSPLLLAMLYEEEIKADFVREAGE